MSSFIVCSKCCISLSSGGCARGSIAFGGRLVLVSNDGAGLGDISQPFIFVTPFAFNSYLKSPLGYGRGQIWIGKRDCLGYGPQSQIYCPTDESRPCLDTTTPCFSDPPAYTKSEPLEFSDITEDSLRVSWPAWNETTDLGVGPVTQYKLQYKEEGSLFEDILLDAYTLQYQFDGLKVGTTYEFRITLIRDFPYIESQPSNVQNATTLYGEPPAYIQDYPLSFTIVTDNSITVTWPVWDETTGTGTGPITGYKLQYREQGNDFQDIVIDDFTVLSSQVDGLKEGNTYQFRIILVSGTIEGSPSLIQNQISCGDINGSELFLTTESRSIGRSRITARWTIRKLPASCAVSQQLITLQQLDNDDCTLPSPGVIKTAKPSKKKKTFSGLRANWDFNITLQLTYPLGVYTLSKIQRTAETAPEAPPSNVKPVVKNNGMKGFKWEEPPCDMCHGKIVKYRYYRQINGGKRSYYVTTDTYLYFKTLAPGSQVTLQVQASTNVDFGPYSDPVTLIV